jgi:hypothetical protein
MGWSCPSTAASRPSEIAPKSVWEARDGYLHSSPRADAARVGLGPVGFEPTTKGFTLPRRFRQEWTISSPVNRVRTDFGDSLRPCGCGMLLPVIKGTEALR